MLARVRLSPQRRSVSTSATDFYPVQAVQMSRFKGETWELFGDVMHNESS